MLISPHSDDETLAADALVAAHCDRGRDVLVIAVTDGENAYNDYEGLRVIGRAKCSSRNRCSERLGFHGQRTRVR